VPGVTALILASGSPARLNTLRNAGIEPEVIVSNVDESVVDSTDPAEVSGTLARLKAEAVAALVARPALVLGCDSVLAFDGRVLGKPADAADARHRWQRMRGRHGVLHTGHWQACRGCRRHHRPLRRRHRRRDRRLRSHG